MKVSLKMEIMKALECIFTKMMMFTWDNGKIIKERAKEYISIGMERGMKGNIKKVKEMA